MLVRGPKPTPGSFLFWDGLRPLVFRFAIFEFFLNVCTITVWLLVIFV